MMMSTENVEAIGETADKRRRAEQNPIGTQWWLAKLDKYGNPKLLDGAHANLAGANRAFYLYQRLKLGDGERYAVVRVELYEPSPNSVGVNELAIDTINQSRSQRLTNAGFTGRMSGKTAVGLMRDPD